MATVDRELIEIQLNCPQGQKESLQMAESKPEVEEEEEKEEEEELLTNGVKICRQTSDAVVL